MTTYPEAALEVTNPAGSDERVGWKNRPSIPSSPHAFLRVAASSIHSPRSGAKANQS
jgi:hypothetical protein